MISIFARDIQEEGLEIDEELSAEDLALIAENDTVYKPLSGHLKLHVEAIGEDVRVGGFISAQISATCVSCLDEFTVDQKIPLELYFSPGEVEKMPAEGEAELILNDEDCGIDHYNPDEPLELGRIAVELLSVELPINPRCKDDCKGLCQDCGANLNHEKCNCRHIADPRWAALAAIKLDK